MRYIVIVHCEDGDTTLDYGPDRESAIAYWQRCVDMGEIATLHAER